MKTLQGLTHLCFQSNIRYLNVSHSMRIINIPSGKKKKHLQLHAQHSVEVASVNYRKKSIDNTVFATPFC